MKNRIEKSKGATNVKAKSMPWSPSEEALKKGCPNDKEMKQVVKGLPKSKRIDLTLTVSLTPIQLRALHYRSKWLHITMDEFATQAIALDLDGYNTNGNTAWDCAVLNSVLEFYPEREKQLGEFSEALNLEDRAHDVQVRMRFAMDEKAGMP